MTTELECITGNPGTGKTYLVKQRTNALLTATTGVAALNLGDHVRTIHSTLGFYDLESLYKAIEKKDVQKRLLLISTLYNEIVVDEISMFSGTMIDILVQEIAKHNKSILENAKLRKKHKFLKLTIVGDAAQLPPPNKENNPFFKANSIKFFKSTHLTEIKRQTDLEFISILNKLRYGKAKEVIDWFDAKVGFHKELDKDFQGATFFPTNNESYEYNLEKLAKLKTPEVTYESEVTGYSDREWKNKIPESVTVKEGMTVMILANDFSQMIANGDLGTLIDCFPKGVLVKLHRDDREVLVEYKTLFNTKITQKKDGTFYERKIGSIQYLPIKQGDSSSYNKGQGLTLPKLQLSFKPTISRRGYPYYFLGSKLSGGLYTGITRVTDYTGLRLVGSKDDFIKSCFIYPMYLEYLLKLDSLSQPQLMAA